MNDVDDRVMTEFLLRTLDEEHQERVFDRLGADPEFFERMAALEDDLILRRHQGELTPAQLEQFARAYAEPSRQRRVEASLAVWRAAQAWKARETATVSRGLLAWLRAPLLVPRLALVSGVVFILGMSLTAFLAIRRTPDATRVVSDPARSITLAMTLTAVGEKGTAKGFDSLRLTPNVDVVQLTVRPDAVTDGGLTATVEGVDGGIVPLLGPPTVSPGAVGEEVTVTIRAQALPDGDYVLTVLRASSTATEIVTRKSFRVSRQPQ